MVNLAMVFIDVILTYPCFRAGMIVVLDLGKWTFRSDLQPPLCLEDVTQMELEERLYDRLHINLEGFQLLFSDSGKCRLIKSFLFEEKRKKQS